MDDVAVLPTDTARCVRTFGVLIAVSVWCVRAQSASLPSSSWLGAGSIPRATSNAGAVCRQRLGLCLSRRCPGWVRLAARNQRAAVELTPT
eukprot:11370428-Alexandrium_andersonii.AAC.1